MSSVMSFVSITYLKNILFTLSYIESLLENFSLGFLGKCFRCSCKYFLNKCSCCSKATYNMQGFPNSVKGGGRGKNPPPPVWVKSDFFCGGGGGGVFIPGVGNLRRIDFDHSNLFES